MLLDSQTASIIGGANNKPTMDPAKFDQLVKSRNIQYILEKHAGKLNPEQLDFCVKKSPSDAIEYALNLLTPKQFDFCRRKRPEEALENKDAAIKLSPRQFALCVYKSPYKALELVASKLSPLQLAFCVEESPMAALLYAAALLSPKQLADCVKKSPWEALLFAVDLISSKQLVDCASRCRVKLINYLRGNANESPKLVRALMAVVSQLPQSTRKAVAMVAAQSI